MQQKVTAIGVAWIVLDYFHFMLYLMNNFLVFFQVLMQIKGYSEMTLVNLTYVAAININSVTLKIILIQITTFMMIYMSIVDIIMTMSLKKNIKQVKAFLSYILIVEVYFTIFIK